METPPIRIPDLDPREDYHWWGRVGLGTGLVLLSLWVLALLLALPLLSARAWLALLLWGLGIAGLSAWIMADGPGRWLLRRRRRRRQRQLAEGDTPLADLRDDPWPTERETRTDRLLARPVWTMADGHTWAVAWLRLPPTLAWTAEQHRRWRAALAAALRVATAQGLLVDVLVEQTSLPDWAPPAGALTPLQRARWEYWADAFGIRSVRTRMLLRFGWPDADQDAALRAFTAVRGAWEGIAPAGGSWFWLPLQALRDSQAVAMSPAAAYDAWKRETYRRLGKPMPTEEEAQHAR